MFKTIEEACSFVKTVKICTIFPSDKVEYPSLWDQVDLPDKQPGEKGWGRKTEAVWSWKNRLPAEYPNDIFYGKIQGGLAVLMDMDYLAKHHFPQAHRPLGRLNQLSQQIFETVSEDLWTTTDLRRAVMEDSNCTKSQFDTALKNLQITLNIVRLNDPRVEHDTWVPFREVYLEVWDRYVDEEG